MPRPSKITVISYRDIGARVRVLRQELGFTQTKLAKILGTTQTALSEVERGNRGLTVQQVVKLARSMKVSPNEILGDKAGNGRRPQSAKVLRRLHLIEQLPERQQDAVLKVIDGILKAHQGAA